MFLLVAAARPAFAAGAGDEATDEQVLAVARDKARVEDYAAAVAAVEAGLRRWPDHHDLLLMLGHLRLWQRDFREALRHFDRCLELVPDSLEALEARYTTLARAGEYDAAAEVVEQLAESLPPARVQEHRLNLLVEQGKLWKARRAAREAEATYGPTPTSRAILEGPVGIHLIPYGFLQSRPGSPLLGWGAEVRFLPTSLFRFWGQYDGSSWQGDVEHFFKGGVRGQTKSGFTALAAVGGSLPGYRMPALELEGGLGWRTPRELELDFGYVIRLFRPGIVMQLFRLGVTIPMGRDTRLALYGYLAPVRFPGSPTVHFGPGSLIRFKRRIFGTLWMSVAYTNGTELYPIDLPNTAVPFRIERFFTHRVTLKSWADITDRVALTASWSVDAWPKPRDLPHLIHLGQVSATFRF